MALINEDKLDRIEKERNFTHKEVEATYTTFHENEGKYFQIDTYGSSDREIKGKVSQSIQLNQKAAKKLIKILMDEFDILE